MLCNEKELREGTISICKLKAEICAMFFLVSQIKEREEINGWMQVSDQNLEFDPLLWLSFWFV